jgi:hypothetical protein
VQPENSINWRNPVPPNLPKAKVLKAIYASARAGWS